MRTLVLGGTGWLGRAIVRKLLSAGADVTCLARGDSGEVPAGARLVRADRRTPGVYDDVPGEWDEVIEVASDPDLVEPALDSLGDRARHWTLVSSVSVYARNDEPGADESASLVDPSDLGGYAEAKVRAERSSAERLGDRLLIGRPGLIVGQGDPTDRFGYWPARLSARGRVLVPTAADRFVQAIDVADLAAWLADAARTRRLGIVNAVGDPLPMAEFFHRLAAVTGFRDDLIEVEDEVLLDHGVHYWAGPRSLPLWLPVTDAAFAQRSSRAYRESGGRFRPLEDTLADVLADERRRGLERPRRAGLTRAEEDQILDAATAR